MRTNYQQQESNATQPSRLESNVCAGGDIEIAPQRPRQFTALGQLFVSLPIYLQAFFGVLLLAITAVLWREYVSVWMLARFDLHAYWDAALKLRAGQPLYATVPVPVQSKAYLYPPAFAAFYSTLTYASRPTGFLIWNLIQLLSFLAVVGASRAFRGAPRQHELLRYLVD